MSTKDEEFLGKKTVKNKIKSQKLYNDVCLFAVKFWKICYANIKMKSFQN